MKKKKETEEKLRRKAKGEATKKVKIKKQNRKRETSQYKTTVTGEESKRGHLSVRGSKRQQQ